MNNTFNLNRFGKEQIKYKEIYKKIKKIKEIKIF